MRETGEAKLIEIIENHNVFDFFPNFAKTLFKLQKALEFFYLPWNTKFVQESNIYFFNLNRAKNVQKSKALGLHYNSQEKASLTYIKKDLRSSGKDKMSDNGAVCNIKTK